jgi:hypothetical protein
MTLDTTRVGPSEYGIRSGSDYPLGAPCLNLDHGGGRPGVHVRYVEFAGLIIYHPHVTSDGGV